MARPTPYARAMIAKASTDPLISSERLTLEDLARRQAEKVVLEDQPGSADIKNTSSFEHQIAGPADNETIGRLLKLSGYKMTPEGSVDMSQFQDKSIPDLESLKEFQTSRPSEIDLSGLENIANALSSTNERFKFAAPKRTAEQNLSDYANIGQHIQKAREEEMKRQSDLFKAITGVQSVRDSSKKVDSTEFKGSNPAPKSSGSGNKKPKELSPSQLSEINIGRDLVQNMKDLVKDLGNHGNWVGPADRLVPEMISSAERNNFRAKLKRIFNKYRTQTTGAAAPYKELEYLMESMPSEADKMPAFLKKAGEVIQETEGAVNRRLDTYQGLGWNTAGLSKMDSDQKEQTVSSEQKEMARKLLEARKAKKQ